MKFWVVISILFFPFLSKSNVDYSTSSTTENARVCFPIGSQKTQLLENKFSICLSAANKLISLNKSNLKVEMNFYKKRDLKDSKYYLSIENIESFKNNHREDEKELGIKITIVDVDVDIEKVTNTIEYALLKNKEIKNNQTKYYFNDIYYRTDSTYSISKELINNAIVYKDEKVNQILNSKLYPYGKPINIRGSLGYYYFKKQFHFYSTNDVEEEYNEKERQSLITKYNSMKEYLVLDNFYESVPVNNENSYLIFNTDSTFYFYENWRDSVRGQFKITHFKRPRENIFNCIEQNLPYRMISFNLYSDKSRSKVLYVVDSSLVIENYDSIEKDFIKNYSHKSFNKANQVNSSKKNLKLLYGLLIGLGLVIITIIFKRKRIC